MKIGLPFILFWPGVICIFVSFWIGDISDPLRKSGYLLILLAFMSAFIKVIDERKKKDKNV